MLKLLNNLTVQQYIAGTPQYADTPIDTQPLPDPTTVSVFGDPAKPGTVAYALLAQYNALGALPNNAGTYGYALGGGGQFNITARTIDSGNVRGHFIPGRGPLHRPRRISTRQSVWHQGTLSSTAANINVATTGNPSDGHTAYGELYGDLDMYSSSIASLDGGSISINAGGNVNAGSSSFTVNTVAVRGIYSTGGGDVSLIANGDVNVNGSRVGSFDGGNVTVASLTGSVNAGTGVSSLRFRDGLL